jgi:hypothetical protein
MCLLVRGLKGVSIFRILLSDSKFAYGKGSPKRLKQKLDFI